MGSYKYKVSEKFRIVSESYDSMKMASRTKVIFSHILVREASSALRALLAHSYFTATNGVRGDGGGILKYTYG